MSKRAPAAHVGRRELAWPPGHCRDFTDRLALCVCRNQLSCIPRTLLIPAQGTNKSIFFVLEGLNALAASYFNSYVFFLLRDRFGFGNLGNLSASALGGLVYVIAAWQGGRFAQRFGYFTALKIGWGGLVVCLTLGALAPSLPAILLVFVGWTAAVCFTWAGARSPGQRRRRRWRASQEHRDLQRRLVRGVGVDVFCRWNAL